MALGRCRAGAPGAGSRPDALTERCAVPARAGTERAGWTRPPVYAIAAPVAALAVVVLSQFLQIIVIIVGAMAAGLALSVGLVLPIRGAVRDAVAKAAHASVAARLAEARPGAPPHGAPGVLIHVPVLTGLASDGTFGLCLPGPSDGNVVDVSAAGGSLAVGGQYLPLAGVRVVHVTAMRTSPVLVAFATLPFAAFVAGIHWALLTYMTRPRIVEDAWVSGEDIAAALVMMLPVAATTVMVKGEVPMPEFFSRFRRRAPPPLVADSRPPQQLPVRRPRTPWREAFRRDALLQAVQRTTSVMHPGVIVVAFLYFTPLFCVYTFRRTPLWASLETGLVVAACAVVHAALVVAVTARVPTHAAFALVPKAWTPPGAPGSGPSCLIPPGAHLFFAASKAARDAWVADIAGAANAAASGGTPVLGVSIHYLRHLVDVAAAAVTSSPDFAVAYSARHTRAVAKGILNPAAAPHRASWADAFLRSPPPAGAGPTDHIPRPAAPVPDVGPATAFISHAWDASFPDLVDAVASHDERLRARAAAFRPASACFDAAFRATGSHFEPPLLAERGPYYWIDIVFKDQTPTVPWLTPAQYDAMMPPARAAHDAQRAAYSAATEREFRAMVRGTGATLMVGNGLAAGETPYALRRCWCLYEVLVTEEERSRFALVQSDARAESLRALDVDIDLETAEAEQPADADRIKSGVRDSVGFAFLNGLVARRVMDGQELFARERASAAARVHTAATVFVHGAILMVELSMAMVLMDIPSMTGGGIRVIYMLLSSVGSLGQAGILWHVARIVAMAAARDGEAATAVADEVAALRAGRGGRLAMTAGGGGIGGESGSKGGGWGVGGGGGGSGGGGEGGGGGGEVVVVVSPIAAGRSGAA
jgi:hypothetical protein